MNLNKILIAFQIAATDCNEEINKYTVPTKLFTLKAAEVTGLKIKRGELYQRDAKISTVSSKTLLVDFLNYLEKIKVQYSTNENECHIILIGHNSFRLFFKLNCMIKYYDI